MDRMKLIAQLIDEKYRTTLAHEKYMAQTREYLPGSHLYMRELHFIIAASQKNESTMTEIAKKLEVTLGAVSQMAERLQHKDYIKRAKSVSDKRQTVVSLTEKGANLLQDYMQYDKEKISWMNEYLQEYDEQTLEFLISYERKMCEALSLRHEADVQQV